MRDTVKAVAKGDWKGAMTAGMMQSVKPWIKHSKTYGIGQAPEAPEEAAPTAPTILTERRDKQRSMFY